MDSILKTVIKIEIETLYDETGVLSPGSMEHLGMVCANLQNSGIGLLIVSSGAIALGAARLGMKDLPSSVTAKQAVAAVGQAELIISYQKYFEDFDQMVAQVLLTRDVIDNPVRNKNARNTLERLLSKGIIPVINENDSVSTSDIIINDNYPLVLIVAALTNAEAIVEITSEKNRFRLIVKNNSEIREITLDELLNISNIVEGIKRDSGMEIDGFPEFYHYSGAN